MNFYQMERLKFKQWNQHIPEFLSKDHLGEMHVQIYFFDIIDWRSEFVFYFTLEDFGDIFDLSVERFSVSGCVKAVFW